MTATATDATIAQRTAMAAASSLSSKTSYASAAGTVFFGVQIEVWGVLAGIIIGIITMLINVYFQKKKHNLDVLLAHSQLEKIANATFDANQMALMEKLRADFFKEFGDVNKRKNGDRRVFDDPNYKGPERRKTNRREGPSGDCEVARTLRIVEKATRDALTELNDRRWKCRFQITKS